MGIVSMVLAGMQLIFLLLSLFLIPGFAITLVYFPQLTEIGIVPRLIYSIGLSFVFVIVAVLFLAGVLGVDTTSRNMDLVVAIFLAIMLVVWLCEVFSLNKTVWKIYSRLLYAATDRRKPATSRVVWHESQRSGMNLINHTYLLDAGREIDIQQVIERSGKIPDIRLVQPPYHRTRYFELALQEYKEKDLSLVNDLQVYPVLVTKKPDIVFLRFVLKQGSSAITQRLYKKDRMAEVQWIYSHDFHLIAITDSDASLDQMVDRIIAKIDQIVTSQGSGSRLSSHLEVTQTLREAFDTVMERPRPPVPVPGKPPVSPRRPYILTTQELKEQDGRKLQKEIVRDLNTFNLTTESFSRSDRLIKTIKIPEKDDINKQLARIKDILDDDWLYE